MKNQVELFHGNSSLRLVPSIIGWKESLNVIETRIYVHVVCGYLVSFLVENSSDVQSFNRQSRTTETIGLFDRLILEFIPTRLLSFLSSFRQPLSSSSHRISSPFFACLLIFCAIGTSRSAAGFSLLCCRRHSAR